MLWWVVVSELVCCDSVALFFFFQAEDGIRDLVRSRGLGDAYKRQARARAQPGERGVGCGAADVRAFATPPRVGLGAARAFCQAQSLSLIHI